MTLEITLPLDDDDERIIELNADQKAVALKHIIELQQAMGTVASVLKGPDASVFKDGLPRGLATNCLSLAEHRMADLGKLLGIETDSAAEMENRFARVRAANMRVRELEAQLGTAQGPDVTKACLKQLDAQLNSWWDLEGFGHISDLSFGKYGCKAKFSCSLFGDFSFQSDTPVSDKERRVLWHASLQERGFVLEQDGRDWEIRDCDASRDALMKLFALRLPSAKVTSFDNHQGHSSGFKMRAVEVFIYELAEIGNLPQKPPKPAK
jgi:hypothetical protein